jgi:hypothetical protein
VEWIGIGVGIGIRVAVVESNLRTDRVQSVFDVVKIFLHLALAGIELFGHLLLDCGEAEIT